MPDIRPFKIVVAVDLSDMSEVVLETALDAGARHDAPALHFLAVLTPSRGFFERKGSGDPSGEIELVAGRLRALVAEKLADFGRPMEQLGGWRVFTHVRVDEPARQIVDLAWEVEADLVILGRHSSAQRRRLLIGSVPQRVMHLARCPVLIAQPVDYRRGDGDDEAPEHCPECVAARRESEGEQWFCRAHSDIRLTRSSYMAHHSSTMPVGGGPLL